MANLPGNLDAAWRFLGEAASGLGFVAVGAAAAGPVSVSARRAFDDWIAKGQNGTMRYLDNHRAQRYDPRHERIVAGADTVICVALPYGSGAVAGGFWDHVAAHARGRDYHSTMRDRLDELGSAVALRFPGCRWRAFVDTAPVLERTWAVAAGLGAIGRHGGLIVQGIGARVILGEIVCAGTPAPEVSPMEQRFGPCVDCDLCVAACPTEAIGVDGAIDARRCLSYQTIEHRGTEAPTDIARRANLVFGCDECTAACPLESADVATELEPPSEYGPRSMSLGRVRDADSIEIEAILEGTCIERSGASMIQRNARSIASRKPELEDDNRGKEGS